MNKIKRGIKKLFMLVCNHHYVHENSPKCGVGRTYYIKCSKCGHEIKSWHMANMGTKE